MVRGLQIKSLLLGQQIQSQTATAGAQANQVRAMDLDAQQRIISAQHDPGWDATDSDKVVSLLTHYGVPVEYQNRVLQGIAQTRQVMAGQSAEQLKSMADFHSFLDDQYQGVSSAPPGQRQSAWEEAKGNARNYVMALPPGPVREVLSKQLDALPVMYDPGFISREHGLLKTATQVNEEALQKAKAAESNAQAGKVQGEGDVSSPFFSPTPQATALAASQGAPWATAVNKGEAAQAGAVAGAKAKAELPYEISKAVQTQLQLQKNAPGALTGVAPHLVGPAANAYEKAGTEYAAAYQSAQNMADFIAAAKSGNKEAVKMVPLQGALEITTAQGVHRITRQEVEQYGGAGSLFDKLYGKVGGVLTGKNIPDDVLDDMNALQATISKNAATLHANKVAAVNASYGSKFQPMDFGPTPGVKTTDATTKKLLAVPPEGATQKVKGSDGKYHWFDDHKNYLGPAE